MYLLFENISLAITSLISNKMRAFLTMLGIIIGIGSVIAIFTVGDSLTLYVSEQMQSLGANDIYIMVTHREDADDESMKGFDFRSMISGSTIDEENYLTPDMINDMLDEFKNEIYTISVQHQISEPSELKYNNREAYGSIFGVNAGYYISNPMKLLAGSNFTAKDYNEKKKVCIIGNKTANKMFETPEDAVGKEIEITVGSRAETFTIIGVFDGSETYASNQTGGISMLTKDAQAMYVPIKTVFDLERKEERFYYISAITQNGVDSQKLAEEISTFFENYYKNNRNYTIAAFNLSSMVTMLTDMLSTLTMAISIVAAIALLVGGIGVMNIMLVSVTERTREIGTRKALGAKNSSIRTQFIVEAMIICLIGGIIGIIVGIVMGAVASNAIGYSAAPSIKGIIISLAFSMSIGLFFGYYPANKAAKMNPIDALRYE